MVKEKWRKRFDYRVYGVMLETRCARCKHWEEVGRRDRCVKHGAFVSWLGLCNAFEDKERDNA